MAILHQANLTPSKLDLLGPWVTGPAQLAEGSATDVELLGAYRFDDPAGVVGIETHLLAAADGTILHVPVVYRASPVQDRADDLIGTLEHSVLGTRWVYDACSDVIYVRELVRCIVDEGTQAQLLVETPDGPVERAPVVAVVGHAGTAASVASIADVEVERDGTDSLIRCGTVTASIHHQIINGSVASEAHLHGSWPTGSAVLAQLLPSAE